MVYKALLFLLICVGPASLALGQKSSKDSEALRSVTISFFEAQNSFDAAALDKVLTSDYVEISPVGEIDSREKVLTFYTPEAKQAASKMSVKALANVESTRVFGKFAVVIATFNYDVSVDGKQLPPRSIRTTLVCRKEGGEWKLASAQFTGIRKSPPPSK